MVAVVQRCSKASVTVDNEIIARIESGLIILLGVCSDDSRKDVDYIANKIVLVPVYNDSRDKIVINIFKKNFKSRKIIPINCSELIWGFGAIHCMTQQEPEVFLSGS